MKFQVGDMVMYVGPAYFVVGDGQAASPGMVGTVLDSHQYNCRAGHTHVFYLVHFTTVKNAIEEELLKKIEPPADYDIDEARREFEMET